MEQRSRGGGRERRGSSAIGDPQHRQEKRDTLRELEHQFKEEERNGCYAEAGRYANKIASVHKSQGALKKALKWLEIDYRYTTKALDDGPRSKQLRRCSTSQQGAGGSASDADMGGLSAATYRDLAATLQALGEVHFSLRNWSKAISYMHRHLELAKKLKNTAEEQRACTQLGRAYLDVFIRGEDMQHLPEASEGRQEKEGHAREEGEGDKDGMDPGKALMEAKTYLENALQIAKQMLTRNRGSGRNQQRGGGRSSNPAQHGRGQAGLESDEGFTGHAHRSSGAGVGGCGTLGAEALADAYLNVGVLFEETDDAEEALKCCSLALQVCDDEEIEPIAEVRSRIHHNLGKLYMRQKDKGRAKQHFTADIAICNRLGLLEEEGKGWTSLGDLHFREEEYEDALRAFTRAHELVLQMEDESELLQTCHSNLGMVHAAQEQIAARDNLWNQHRKIQRMLQRSRSMEEKLKLLADDKKVLKELLDVAESMQAFYTQAKAAAEYVSVAEGLGDTQSQCDAAEIMAHSSYCLNQYDDAMHWYQRSLDFCRTLKHTEGQSVALMGLGNVLDGKRQWEAALEKYQQALRIARSEGERKYPAQELKVLENIQYIYLLRFHDFAKSREVVAEVRSLKSFLARQEREEQRLRRQEAKARAPDVANSDADADAAAEAVETQAGEAEGSGAPGVARSNSTGTPRDGKRGTKGRSGSRIRWRDRRGAVEEEEEERWEDEEDEEEEEVARGEPVLPILDSPEIGRRKGARAGSDRAAPTTGPSVKTAAQEEDEQEEDEGEEEEEWGEDILLGQPPTDAEDIGGDHETLVVEDSQPATQWPGTQDPRAAGARPRTHWTATHALGQAARGTPQAGSAPHRKGGASEGVGAGAGGEGGLHRGRGEAGEEGREADVEEVPDSEDEEAGGEGGASGYTAGRSGGARRPRMDLSWARQGRGAGGGARAGLGGGNAPKPGNAGGATPGVPPLPRSQPPCPAPRPSASARQGGRPSVGLVSRSKVLLDSPDDDEEGGAGVPVPCPPTSVLGTPGAVQGPGQRQEQLPSGGEGQGTSGGGGRPSGDARNPAQAKGVLPERGGKVDPGASTLGASKGVAGGKGVKASAEEGVSREDPKGLGSASSPVVGGAGGGRGGEGVDLRGKKELPGGEEHYAGSGLTEAQGTGRADRLAVTGQQPRIWPCAAGPTSGTVQTPNHGSHAPFSGSPATALGPQQGPLTAPSPNSPAPFPGSPAPYPGSPAPFAGSAAPHPGLQAFPLSAGAAEGPHTAHSGFPPLPPFVLLSILNDTLQVPLPTNELADASPTVQWLIGTCTHLYLSYHPEETEAPKIRRLLCNGITLAPQLPLAVALQVSSPAARAASPGTGPGATPGVPLLVAVVEGTTPCSLAERYRLECAEAGAGADAAAEELLRTLQRSPKRAAEGLVEVLRQREGDAASSGKGREDEAPRAQAQGASLGEEAEQEPEAASSGGSLLDVFLGKTLKA